MWTTAGAWVAPHAQAREPFDVLDRMLLRGDGTVSTLLEVCTSEPIDTFVTFEVGPAPAGALIETTQQPCRREDVFAFVLPSERVILRRAILRGARTRLPYVLAESLLVPDRLPPEVVRQIRSTGGSIGTALTEHAVESRRAIVTIEHGLAGAVAEELLTTADAPIGRRTYTIAVHGRVAVFMTETLVAGRLRAAVGS
ncbi:MAG: chorismate pyruvate-lyase family protein [Conexibacter sp.]